MRWVVAFCIACGGSRPVDVVPLDPPRAVAVDASVPDASPDPDDDRLLAPCDLCPDEAETYNGILDEDGCPDSSGTSHAVMFHPTNRFGHPSVALRFGAPLARWTFDDDVQVIAVIARARVGTKPTDVAKQAARVVRHLRGYVAAQVDSHVTGAPRLYDDEGDDPAGDVILQVMRAGDVDVWRWHDDQLVRATPRVRLESPKLPAGC